MTLSDRIRELLVAEYPANLTNRQIADRLQTHEPSVRRATLRLWDQWMLQDAGTCPLTFAKCYRAAQTV